MSDKYNLAIWSQSTERRLQRKLSQLGILDHVEYNICLSESSSWFSGNCAHLIIIIIIIVMIVIMAASPRSNHHALGSVHARGKAILGTWHSGGLLPHHLRTSFQPPPLSPSLSITALLLCPPPPTPHWTMHHGTIQHAVKPLQLIWTHVPTTGPQNTVHVDDLSRNFALNPRNGIKIRGYSMDDRDQDCELLWLAQYLLDIADCPDISAIAHDKWKSFSKKIVQRKLRGDGGAE